METTLIKIGPKDALILVDFEVEFARKKGALFVPGIPGEPTMKGVIANARQLLTLPFGRVIPTRDAHPDDHIEHEIYGKHCVMGTPGCQIIPEIMNPLRHHTAYRYDLSKGHDSRLIGYSLVYSQDFSLFIADLRQNGFERIFFCGLAFTHCVGESAIDCVRQMFDVYIIRNASRSIPPPYGDANNMLDKLAAYKVNVIRMEDINWSE